MSRKEVKKEKEEHWKSCEGKRRRVIYFNDRDEEGLELLDWKQQEVFEKIKAIRNVGAKLEALYKACGKPVPGTYRSSNPLVTISQPIIGYHLCWKYANGRVFPRYDRCIPGSATPGELRVRCSHHGKP